jgi:hypothetical protein
MAIAEIVKSLLKTGARFLPEGAPSTRGSLSLQAAPQTGNGRLRVRPGTPPAAQRPPPPQTPRRSVPIDPHTPGLGQPTPGTGGDDNFQRGRTVSAAAGAAGVINDLGDQQRFYRHLRTHMAFQAAGGEDGRVRKVGPDATYLGPEPEIYDFLGNKGVRMTNGHEFWRVKIHGLRPKGFNVHVKTANGVRLYSVFEGPWTSEWPGDNK